MFLYRLTQKKYSDSPFDPVGAKMYGGRWNSKGVEALYFAGSESLCTLEVLVHVKSSPEIIDKYDLFSIDMPDDLIAVLEDADLPARWRDIPPSEETQRIGDEFLAAVEEHRFAALQIPSVISSRDKNFLVNPKHPMMSEVFKGSKKMDFSFDPRIFK